VRNDEEEDVCGEDDGLLQEEEKSSQSYITEDIAQKRKYICHTVL
jgi:hypothetical protein